MNKNQVKIMRQGEIRFIGMRWPEDFLNNRMRNTLDLQSTVERDGIII